jgi:hypothetical protein
MAAVARTSGPAPDGHRSSATHRSVLVLPHTQLPITFRPGRRMGQASVALDADGLPGDPPGVMARVSLNYALLRLNQTPIGRRYPVVAAPGLASADFLRGTFARRHVSMIVPVTVARVDADDGDVLWLDRRQVDVLDGAASGLARVLRGHAEQQVTLPTREILGHVYAYADGLPAATQRPAYRTYDEIVPAALPADVDSGRQLTGLRLRAIAPTGTFDGFGQAVIRLGRTDARRLDMARKDRNPRHVIVRPVTRYRGDVEVLARLLVRDGGADEGAELDQVVREAIGVEIGEEVLLSPAVVRRRRWSDPAIGRPNHVTCRVQDADLSTLEREVCLLDPLTLELLGVSSGDEVVIDGLNGGGSPVVSSIRVRAFATSAAVQQRREALHGGDFGARFPSARDALGVHPDLPWIFLVGTTQQRLRLRAAALATVRVRSSRSYQLRKEVREIALLLGIAFIGLLQLIDDRRLQSAAVLALLASVAVSIVVRMRGRLSYRVRRRRGS